MDDDRWGMHDPYDRRGPDPRDRPSFVVLVNNLDPEKVYTKGLFHLFRCDAVGLSFVGRHLFNVVSLYCSTCGPVVKLRIMRKGDAALVEFGHPDATWLAKSCFDGMSLWGNKVRA